MQITVDMIKNLPLFAKLSEDEIASSLKIFKLIEPEEPNYVIFKEGGVGDSLFLVLKGQVEIQKLIDVNANTSKVLAILPQGSFFGEMALLTGETRSASAIMRGVNGKLIKVERNDFMNFMSTSPKVASLLLGCLVSSLSDRLRATSTEVVTLYETGRIIGQTTDFNSMVSQVLDRLIKVTNATAGFVMMWNDVVECFECKIGLPEVPPVSLLQSGSILSRYWLNLDLPVTQDTTNDFVDTSEIGFNLPSVMYVPLRVKVEDSKNDYKKVDVVAGMIVLVSNQAKAFSLQHINLARSVASQVGQAVVNTRLLMENEARRCHERVYVTADF